MLELEDIEGIGPKKRSKLLKAFGSIKRIKEESLQQLTEVIGPVNGKVVYDYYQNENKED